MSEDGKTNIIHSIAYGDLCGFLGKASCVENLTTYNLPVRSADYVGKAAELIEALIGFYADEGEKWRMRTEKLVQTKRGENDIICLGKRTLYDADGVYAISKLDSFFVLPGKKSVQEGGFSPSEVIQLSGLITLRPLVLRLEDEVVDAEKGIWRLTGVLRDMPKGAKEEK